MKVRVLRWRRPITIALHVAFTVVSYVAAYLLRFDFTVPPEHLRTFLIALPWLIGIRALTFWAFRLYEGLWRYASVWDLNNIIMAVGASSGAFLLLVSNVLQLTPYPRSIVFIDSLLLVCILGGVRMARRTYHEFDRISREKRILIYGAGDAGEMIVRDIKNNGFYNYDPIGFVDDDPHKVGRFIHGVRVLGTRHDLPAIMAAHQPHELLIAIARAEPFQMRQLVKHLEPYKLPIKTLPNLRDVLEGKVELTAIRNLGLEDLMPRQPVDLDAEPVRRLINGRTVLVTGAGGSIGSELSAQLAEYGPARLLILDRYENSLFDLANRLTTRTPTCAFEAVIADITDRDRIETLLESARPDIVFHAAAHKHVPLMEMNPCEAIKNNVRGTRVLATAAQRHGVREFVLISSDKAVNPSSVMGATKRVAEHIVRGLNRPGGTRFVAVRFGNVLGSNGSVTRVFAEQIARGGPVTVTHPEIRRYFMLIPEAVQLVLHAAAAREVGIFALEMGDQIRIQDLARNLIRLSGYVPDEEIAVQFTGLRPGEKLYEELFENEETAEPSQVNKVLRVSAPPPPSDLSRLIERLETAADQGSSAEVMSLLSTLVPTFRRDSADVAAAPPSVLRHVPRNGQQGA